jgi:competence protein ComEA
MQSIQRAGFVLIALWFPAALVPATAQSLKLPDAPGRATTEKVCGACHGAELLIGRQETKETWAAVVDDMIQRGATGTDDEFFEVVNYLSTNFSKTSPVVKVNVNKATAKDLEGALRIPEKQAAAIVHQRDEKGDFKSIDDLKKVPGIDASKIEANKNRLAF